MSQIWIVPLAGVGLVDAARLGGKAAGLGDALAARQPVPPGFVIVPEALDAVLEFNGWRAEHATAIAYARLDDLGPASTLAGRIAAAAWPEALAEAVEAAARALGAERVAVRSSSTLEDTGATAAAGVFETRLDVAPAGLRSAINGCWAAALREPALAHALAMGLDPALGRLALVVQPMLAPTAAGVVFSMDPADPTRTRLRLGVTAGLGEALVQGEAGSDASVPREGRVSAKVLTEFPWILDLRARVLALETRRGCAVDVEFAYDGSLQLLQVRPIATFAPGDHLRPPIRWSRDLAEERFPDPITPMGWSVLQGAFRANLNTLDRRFGLRARRPEEVATVLDGYVYNNRDFFDVPGSLRFQLAPHLPFVGAYLRLAARLLTPATLFTLLRWRKPKRGALGVDLHDQRFFAVAALFEAFVFAHAQQVEAAWERDFEGLIARLDALGHENFAARSDEGLQAFIDRRLSALDAYMEPDLAIYVIKVACKWLLEEIALLARGEHDPELIPRLTGGLEANATLMMNQQLDALAREVASDTLLSSALRLGDRGAVPRAWDRSPARPARDRFLARYGHVTLSWDVRQPPLVERPDLLDDLLYQRMRPPAEMLSRDPGSVAPAGHRQAALAEAREVELARLLADVQSVRWAPAFVRRLVGTLHTFIRLDEEHHLFCSRALPTDRRLLAELAARLIKRGAIDDPDDIFFLTMDEARAMLGERAPFSRRRLVARRRQAFERARSSRPPEAYEGHLPVMAERVVSATDGTLVGQGASPGTVEGIVRVVASLADMAAFRPGEVLVVPTPKPSYTPLFAVAAGLVCARGSTLSHGLIGAREYGLPAVTEVPDALERLLTGQRVRLDGTVGTVTVLDAVTARP